MICNSLSFIFINSLSFIFINYSLKGWAKLLYCPRRDKLLALQESPRNIQELCPQDYILQIYPQNLLILPTITTWKTQKYTNNETKLKEWRLCCPTKASSAHLRQLRSDAHTPLTAHRGFGCQQRWFKKKKPAKHMGLHCTSISYQPDLALRTTCSKSPPEHKGSVFLHESLAAPLDLKTRNTQTLGCIAFREATVDKCITQHHARNIHKLYFAEKAEIANFAMQGEGGYTPMEN